MDNLRMNFGKNLSEGGGGLVGNSASFLKKTQFKPTYIYKTEQITNQRVTYGHEHRWYWKKKKITFIDFKAFNLSTVDLVYKLKLRFLKRGSRITDETPSPLVRVSESFP